MRAEASFDIVHFEEGFHEVDEATFEMPHMDALFDHQAFNLVEHRGVSCVPIIPVDAARRQDADGRLLAHHRPNLYRRRMRAEHFRVAALWRFHEEGIVGFAGRVAFWEVQRREIVPVILDVWTFSDGKAHIAKDSCDFFKDLHNGVQRAGMFRLWRQGHIECFGGELGL